MKRHLVAALAVLAVAVGACSSGDDEAETATSAGETTTTAPTAEVNALEADLEAMLLRLDDMPTGWAEAPIPDEGPLCSDVEMDARVRYAADPSSGPALTEELTAGDGAQLFRTATEGLDGCNTERNGLRYEFSSSNTPAAAGDESAGYRATVTDAASGRTFAIHVIVFRVGDVVGVVSAVDVLGDASALLAEYGPIAVERVRTA